MINWKQLEKGKESREKLEAQSQDAFLLLPCLHLFPFFRGSATWILLLHFLRSWASSSFKPSSSSLFCKPSLHLLGERPLLLSPFTGTSQACLTTSSSLFLNTCPYHLNLLTSITDTTFDVTVVLLLTSSFLILSFKVTPSILLNTFISVVSSLLSSFFFNVQYSGPYIITDLTTVLYTFTFSLIGILLSFMTALTSFHFIQLALTLACTSFSHPPDSKITDPRYLKLSTWFSSSPFLSRTTTFAPPFLQHTIVSVFLIFIFRPNRSRLFCHFTDLSYSCSSLSAIITKSSANSSSHKFSARRCSERTSMMTANRSGLKADPWSHRKTRLFWPKVSCPQVTAKRMAVFN